MRTSKRLRFLGSLTLFTLVMAGCSDSDVFEDAGGVVDFDAGDAGDAGAADAMADGFAPTDSAGGPDTSLPDAGRSDAGPDAVCVEETCDGSDNDCDGIVDEGLTQSCGSDIGVCAPGVRECVGGELTACQGAVESEGEVCDGIDNDCDGTVDDGIAARTCGTNVGACRTGTRRCTNGAFGTCSGNVAPTTEREDGIDNDCDGSVDEGFPCLSGAAAQNFRILNGERAACGHGPACLHLQPLDPPCRGGTCPMALR